MPYLSVLSAWGSFLTLLGLLTLACGRELPAQARPDRPDQRDVVMLKGGRQLKGRVLLRYGPKEITLLQKGVRKRIPRRRLESMVTVNDHLREIYRQLDLHPEDLGFQWTLVRWAESKGLHGMGRLLALDLVLSQPDHAKAHLLLGHKQRQGSWRWPLGSRFVGKKTYEKYIADMGHPLRLVGEHFELETDAGLRRAVDSLLDLERLYLFWMAEFGEALQLREALRPMTLRIWAREGDFPAATGRKEAYFFGLNHGEYGATFYRSKEGDAERPVRLFSLACQAMIDRTLISQKNNPGNDPYSRICAWAEIGLSQWVGSRMVGRPGRAKPTTTPQLERQALHLALATESELKITTHLQYTLFLDPGDRQPEHWATTWAFVHFLMDEEQAPNLKPGFLSYCFEAWHEGKGDSSSALDRALGEKLEKVERRYRAWLKQSLQ